MKTIKINKGKLIHEIEKNRNAHEVIYNEAMEGWQREVIASLAMALKRAKEGKEYITDLELVEPPCHLEEYDNILERIKWHEDDIIELDHREFNQFVLDKWDWQHYFLTTSASYSSSSSSSSSSTLMDKMRTLKING